MIRQLHLAAACLAVTIILAATVQAQDRRSPRNIEDAASRVADLPEKAKGIAERYQRWEKDGKLLQPDEPSHPRRLDALLKEMLDVLQPIRAAYEAAVTNDGYTAADAQVQKVIEGFQKVEDQFIAMGYWYPRKLTDKPLKEELDLAYARTLACRGMLEAKGGGSLDVAKDLLAQAEKKLADMVKQSEKDADAGTKGNSTPDLAKNAYFLAARKEIDRLKADSESGMKVMSGGRDKAKDDWKALAQLWQANSEEIRKLDMSRIQQNEWAGLLDRIEAFEAKLPAIKKALDEFTKTYGQSASEIVEKMRSILGDEFHQMPSSPGLAEAANGLLEVGKTLPTIRKDMASMIYNDSMQSVDSVKSYDENRRVAALGDIAKRLQLAGRYDPRNADVQGQLKKMGDVVGQATAEVSKSIDARTWPGHIAAFQGPGSVESLSRSILEYTAKSKWMGNQAKDASKPLAVCITSNWFSGSQNILGETTSWMLKASVAFERDKDADIADVFDVTIRTQTEKGIAKAPPWAGMGGGNPWQMRLSKVFSSPKATLSAGITPPAAGGIGLFTLLLALANIVAGVLAIGPFLSGKLPQAKGFYIAVNPVRGLLGVVVLCVGIMCLFWCLVTLRPMANLLPQLTAIMAGLLLGKEVLLRRTAAAPPIATPEGRAAKPMQAVGNAARKTQDFLIGHHQVFDQLEKAQMPIGVACLVLGILHLIIGGWQLI